MEAKIEVKPFYKLSLRFFHPSRDPHDITVLLNLKPDHAWKAGERAKTPAGDPLNSIRDQTYWCYSTYADDKEFGTEIDELITYLVPHRDYLHQITTEGGHVELYLSLPGSTNIGDTISMTILS